MESGIYRIQMDGRWNLKDLYEFPHAYLQVYAFVYAFDTQLPARDADRINYALESYPWRGGFSIVNIYTVLQTQMGVGFRPVIKEIRYASPGWIDILLHLHPAVKIAASIAAVATSAAATVKAYAAIQDCLYKISSRAKEAKVERVKLSRQEAQELEGFCNDLASSIGFENLRELQERTGSVEVTAKLLSAQFRRLKTLAKFVTDGKASFPLAPPSQLPPPPRPPRQSGAQNDG